MKDRIKDLVGSEKSILAYCEKTGAGDQPRRFTFAISSEEVDRHGDVVMQDALIASIKKDFVKNSICLPCHKHNLDDGTPPVVGSWDCESVKKSGKKTLLDLIFSEGDLGEKYHKEYAAGHMKAVSVGFRVLDAHVDVVGGKNVYIITKVELYEISCVAVGANRQALRKNLGVDDSDVASQLKDFEKRITDYMEEKFTVIALKLGVEPGDLVEDFYADNESDEADEPAGNDKSAGDDGLNLLLDWAQN